ncbi:MAG: ABC transporter substrate-binding protein [Rhizonema sp. PD37]|nr:ABC transporter substrate-binding protein [Rhizonema sp. PD37]
MKAGPIYKQHQLVLISPASTVSRERLNLKYNKYVFRTAYTDSTEAGDLISYMRQSQPPLKRAVIVKHPDQEEVYSDSLSYEFKKQLTTNNQEQVVEICTVDEKISDDEQKRIIQNCIRNHQNNADVILVALARKSLENKEHVFFNDNRNLKVLGGDTMYSINLTTEYSNAIKEKLVVSVPWNRSNRNKQKSSFEKESEHLWGKVNWRTAMTYDATKAMVDALKNKNDNPSREDLYNALKDNFSTESATGKEVKFCDNSDRKPDTGLGVLVKVEDLSYDHTKPQLDFVITNTPTRNESCM